MIEVSQLSKTYGPRAAVDGISFSVSRGEILGFLGPNGAGKTTTMRMLTGFVPPTRGTAKVAGFDVQRAPIEVKRRTGYLPEHPPLYREMQVRPFLRFVATIRGVPRRSLRAKTDRAIERCGLNDVAGRVIGNLSKGYQQRVGLAQAILHEPEVLILDEPTIGLDPSQIREIRELIRSFGGDHTVILSTHILAEVTVTCGRVLIINKGRIAAEDTLEALAARGQTTRQLYLRLARVADGAIDLIRSVPGVLKVERANGRDGSFRIEMEPGRDASEEIAKRAVSHGCGLLEMRPITMSLEEIFIRIIRDEAI